MNGYDEEADRWRGIWPARTLASRRGWRILGAALAAIALLLLSPALVSALMGGNGLMWTVWSSAPVELVVCWENPNAADPLPGEADRTSGSLRREWVRLALKRSWEREARIILTGWQTCQNEDNPAQPPFTLGPRRPGTLDENIKIQITTSGGGQNPAHGSWGDYMQSGVRLNLHCGSRDCIEFLAIHEFGHVLGLYHGEERSDWNVPGCPPQTYDPSYPWWPVPGERLWGAPDAASIMAYCSNRPTKLSPGDIAGIQRAYERHLPGTLLSLPGSLCLSAHADAANGAGAFGWACDEALDDQEWRYDIATRALYIRPPADPTRRCLDVDTVTGSVVRIWDCHQGSNQQWRFEDVVVRGFGGLCLTRSGTGTSALTMQPCADTYPVYLPLVVRATGSFAVASASRGAAPAQTLSTAGQGFVTQRWRIEPSTVPGAVRLRTLTGDLCLTQSGGSGCDALAAPCTTGTTSDIQDFLLGTGGQISSISFTHGALCLDVEDVLDRAYTLGNGGPAAGQRVRFIECSIDTQLTQNWNFSGHVVSGGKCLALGGLNTQNGAGALMMPCTTALGQTWDYHW